MIDFKEEKCVFIDILRQYCKVNTNHQIEEAIDKATARGYIPRNWNDVGELYNIVSRIHR